MEHLRSKILNINNKIIKMDSYKIYNNFYNNPIEFNKMYRNIHFEFDINEEIKKYANSHEFSFIVIEIRGVNESNRYRLFKEKDNIIIVNSFKGE